MTHGANRVTARATVDDRRTEPTLTLSSGEIRALLAAFAELGYDDDVLGTAAGFTRADLGDPDLRIPCEAYGTIVRQAMVLGPRANLALHVARKIPIGAFPLLDYLILTSDDVGGGLRQLSRYFRLVGNPLDIAVEDEADPVRVVFVDRGGAMPFVIEYTASLLILHFQRETGGRFRASAIHLAHVPDDAREFGTILQCRVEAPSAWSGVSVSRAACALDLPRRDPVLRRLLESQAGEAVTRAPRDASVAAAVQRVLASCAANAAEVRIGRVARRLALSQRTLQRRLASEGWSYGRLLDDWRREAAGRQVAECRLAVSEIACLLGYSEAAPFHRAFRRWFGTTPRAYREKRRSVETVTD